MGAPKHNHYQLLSQGIQEKLRISLRITFCNQHFTASLNISSFCHKKKIIHWRNPVADETEKSAQSQMSPINHVAGEMRTASLKRDEAKGNCVTMLSCIYKIQVQGAHNVQEKASFLSLFLNVFEKVK